MPVPLFADGGHSAFLPEVVALLASCVVVLYVCQRLRLVPIVAFLLTGVLIGPNALGLVRDSQRVEVFAEVGVMLLLFTIGMEFSLDELVRLVRLILVGGGLQIGAVRRPGGRGAGLLRRGLAGGRVHGMPARA